MPRPQSMKRLQKAPVKRKADEISKPKKDTRSANQQDIDRLVEFIDTAVERGTSTDLYGDLMKNASMWKMMRSVTPKVLGEFNEDRHEWQQTMVGHLRSLITEIETCMTAKITEMQTTQSTANDTLAELTTLRDTANTNFEQKKENLTNLKTQSKERIAAVKELTKTEGTLNKDLEKLQKELEQLTEQKTNLEGMYNTHYKNVFWEPTEAPPAVEGEEAPPAPEPEKPEFSKKQHIKKIMAELEEHELEEGCFEALPGVLSKKLSELGAFDIVVKDFVDKWMVDAVVGFGTKIEAKTLEVTAKTEEVSAGVAAREAAEQARDTTATEVEQATEAQHLAKTDLAEREKAIKNHEKEHRELHDRIAEHQTWQKEMGWSHMLFDMLAVRERPAPAPEPVAEPVEEVVMDEPMNAAVAA